MWLFQESVQISACFGDRRYREEKRSLYPRRFSSRVYELNLLWTHWQEKRYTHLLTFNIICPGHHWAGGEIFL